VRKTPEISVPRFDKVSCKTICMKWHWQVSDGKPL
jgi:hypothetical protein